MHCCKGVNNCCQSMEKCCSGCCDWVNKYFQKPFSLCTCMTFFFLGIPLVIGIAFIGMEASDASKYCDKPVLIHAVIIAVCLLLNILFCVYLFCRFGKKIEGYNKGA